MEESVSIEDEEGAEFECVTVSVSVSRIMESDFKEFIELSLPGWDAHLKWTLRLFHTEAQSGPFLSYFLHVQPRAQMSFYRIRATFGIEFSIRKSQGGDVPLKRHQHSDKCFQSSVHRQQLTWGIKNFISMRRLQSNLCSEQSASYSEDLLAARLRIRVHEVSDGVVLRQPIDLSSPTCPGSNLIVQCADRRLYCHRDVLLLESEFFRGLLSNECRESQSGVVSLDDEDFNEVRLFVEHLYPDCTQPITMDTVECLCRLSDKYLCAKVRARCIQFILKSLCSHVSLRMFLINSKYLHSDFIAQTCLELVEELKWGEVKCSASFMELSSQNRSLIMERLLDKCDISRCSSVSSLPQQPSARKSSSVSQS